MGGFKLLKAAGEKGSLAVVPSQGDGAAVADGGLLSGAYSAQEIGFGSVKEMVVEEITFEGVNDGERGLGAFRHGDCDSSIQRNDGRRLRPLQQVVQAENFTPAGIGGTGGAAVLGSDGGLDCERTGIAGHSGLGERQAFLNLGLVPERAVLVFEEDQFAFGVIAGFAAGVVKQHQRQQAGCFGWGLGSHQGRDETAETNGFATEIDAQQGIAASGGVAFVEDEVDGGENRVKAGRHFLDCGNDVGDAGVADFSLRSDESLSHGCGGHKEGAGDFVSIEAA